jgi:hypothetical protein
MKIELASLEGVITAKNTSVLSTVIYALGIAVEHEDDTRVKKDLEAVEAALMRAKDLILVYGEAA